MLPKGPGADIQPVRIIDVPADFDPSATHLLVKRVGYRTYRVSGLIDHPDITSAIRLPQTVLANRAIAIEVATDLARRFRLRTIFIDTHFNAYRR